MNIREKERGGGTLTWWKPTIEVTQRVVIGKDSNLLRCNLSSEITFWIANLYINKKNKLETLDIFRSLQQTVPSPQWRYLVVVGDLNINTKDSEDGCFKALLSICKQMGLTMQKVGPTRGESELDIVLTGSEIKDVKILLYQSPSDHQGVYCSFRLSKARISSMKLRIPNRKVADRITIQALAESIGAKTFLDNIIEKMARRNFSIMSDIKIKPKRNELLERIISIKDEDDDIAQIIKDYWIEMSLNNEKLRYSPDSKEAFSLMKKIYKYHQYDRRDGSIVNKILLPSGEIVEDQERVSKILIEEMKNIQITNQESLYDTYIPFPTLPVLSDKECKEIMMSISHNKAIAFDGVTDILFTREFLDASSKILCNLWSIDWDSIEGSELFFKSRLIPLNKNFPKMPGPKDFRPIIISSPVVKLLEALLLPKIRDYLSQKLYRGQVGFVKGMGTSVNLGRLIQRYAQLNSEKKKAYALFLDFKSAYNTVLHSKLFKRLRKIMTEDEIQLIKAIYSRQKISVNGCEFTPNCGVPQGSLISPGLFNIYVEPLYRRIEKEGVQIDDILAYADDLLIICTSIQQLRKVIATIKKWCRKNNIQLNEKKSGIVELIPRLGSHKLEYKEGDTIEGIPFTTKYKYLGTWISNKVTIDLQLEHIKHKTNFLVTKLYPLLNDVSLSYRINLWKVFVRPLFDQLMHMYYAERAKTNKIKAERLFKYTFKRFTLLTKRTPDRIIYQLSETNLEDRSALVTLVAEKKWCLRKGDVFSRDNEIVFPPPKSRLILPKEVQVFINLSRSICKCDHLSIMSPEHLKETHHENIPSYEQMFEELRQMVVYKNNNKSRRVIDRARSLELGKNYINNYISCLYKYLGT